jgi:hypothetical protein
MKKLNEEGLVGEEEWFARLCLVQQTSRSQPNVTCIIDASSAAQNLSFSTYRSVWLLYRGGWNIQM